MEKQPIYVPEVLNSPLSNSLHMSMDPFASDQMMSTGQLRLKQMLDVDPFAEDQEELLNKSAHISLNLDESEMTHKNLMTQSAMI